MSSRSRYLALCLVLLLASCDAAADVGTTIEDAADVVTGRAFPEPIHYLALGDSVAAGSAAGTSYVIEYAAWFEQESGSSVLVNNAAVPGWTAADLLTAVREDEELRRELGTAHLVTFNVGGNDLLGALWILHQGRCGGSDGQRCLREAVTELTTTWDELLAELLAVTSGEVAGIRTMDLYPPRELTGDTSGAAFLRGYLDEVNDHVRRSSEAVGIEVARVQVAFTEAERDEEVPGWFAADGIHPSDAGHAAIADELADLGTGLNDDG